MARRTTHFALLSLLAATAFAQETSPTQPVPSTEQPAAAPTPPPPQPLPHATAEELDRLVAPIALYPDPLIAQVLPASTYPLDIVKAARLVSAGESAKIDQQDWDPSVKAVARYPDVIKMMDSSIDWTQQLGQAFLAQPEDVMQAVQRMRMRAIEMGNLADTPQQQIVHEEETVRILPADTQIIYVPVYQPVLVYYRRPAYRTSFIAFGHGYPCGPWLDLDCDWRRRWCYRPGWTWNHWRENVIVRGGRVVRVHRTFEPHPDHRPPTEWRRNPGKPLTLPGRPIITPAEYDRLKGRQHDGRLYDRTKRPDITTDRDLPVNPRTTPLPPSRAPDRSRDTAKPAPAPTPKPSALPPSRATPTPAPTPKPTAPPPSPPAAKPTPRPDPKPAQPPRTAPPPTPAPKPAPPPRTTPPPAPKPAPAPTPKPTPPPERPK